MTDYPFVKGHGTENDFVLLPDPDGSVHGELTAERVRALCDRRAGIGGDGVLRVVRGEVYGADTPWFMDYRNSDGSVSEMCGNGIRVFARFLQLTEAATGTIAVGTRDGVKSVVFEEDGRITADLGEPEVLGESTVSVGDRSWSALHVSTGNPHAVAFVDALTDAGSLVDEPDYDPAVYPDGVNVEFVVRRGERHVAMRVHERGSGATRSCGTGACAVMVASALADGAGPGSTYRVDVPGGELEVTWTDDNRLLLTGPAVLVATGTTDL
ncbi:diaminopimelate epimerase [Nocardioides sp.]|uniref:diaminopimelate epimerase n=1 Tax=Nocardioides sp. TaxID=35761 RepID=UPI003D13A097